MKLPILYHKAKGGDLRQWQVWTEGDTIVTEYGTVGGKLQRSHKRATAKNVGRSNATTSVEQAKLEAQSLWTHKVQRKYSETPQEAQEQLLLPMLAHSFKGTKRNKLTYPVDVQPKLDGVRCLAYRQGNNIELTSRQDKPWNIPFVAKQLGEWMPEGMVLDGELYVHGESCQKITSWAKSADPEGKSYKPESQQLIYCVYDMPACDHRDDKPWTERKRNLWEYLVVSSNVDQVPTHRAKNEISILNCHGNFIRMGYEGAIVRHPQGLYLWGYRSADLLKVKAFQDSEFRVVGARDGKGKMKNCVVFICQNDLTDGTFEVTMKATMDERRRMYHRRSDYIGQMLTVRFFDRTDDQIPRFPVGIVFRDKIDLP